MNKTLIAAVAAAMAGGCRMKEFSSSPLYSGSEVKFTGAVEDRVNLWPLAYWREPVGSIAWPLISWGDDHLAFRPVYSQYRQRASGDYDEFNVLWPISQFDMKHSDYRVFPAFWGRSYDGKPYFCLFPAAWWNRDFAGVLPVLWKNGGNEGDGGFCVFPLYWAGWRAKNRHLRHTLWPLYYYRSHELTEQTEESSTFWAACGLAGFNRINGEFTDHHVLPLYLWNHGDFYSLPYSRFGEDGRAKNRILCGIVGMDSSADGEYDASWLFPLYYHGKEAFVTPLFGKSGDASWVLPLYYQDSELFNSPVVSCWHDAKKGTRGFFSLPILSGASWETDSRTKTWLSLAGLVGGASDAEGKKKCEWALPLFIRENERSFHSLPYGWSGGGSAYTNTYFAAGLAGLKSGQKEGGWMFPLFNHKKDADFDKKESWMDAAKLPEDIKVWTEIETNREWNVKTRGHETVVGPKTHVTDVYACNEKTHLLFSDNDISLHGSARYSVTNRYELTETHKIGNRLLFRYEGERNVTFDTLTRDKVGDEESGEASLLLLLYNYNHKSDKGKGTSYASHRVLWKLWDWEEENGDVSLDVFPGFTHDSKKNGYRKTSFLWRFFSYENDPADGKKVDVLFIPVLRQGNDNDN